MITGMELISIDNTITKNGKIAKITEIGSLAKEVLSDSDAHKEYGKEVSHDKKLRLY